MPHRQLILNECIQQLLNYSRWRIKIWRKYKARAKFVAEIMQQYISEGNVDGAENIVRDQMRLLTLYDNPLFAYSKKELYKHHEDTPFAQKDSYFDREDNYYKILHKTLQQLATKGSDPSSLPGVNITHRIWLGGNISQENITKIKCANIAMAKKWLNKQTKKTVKLKHYIWTNRQDLINGLHSIPNTEFKDVMLLFENRSRVTPLFQSFVEHKEYAFASDLARFEACYKYGGLFLGISWSAAPDAQRKEFFIPDMNSVRLFVIRTESDVFLPHPFSGNPHKQLLYRIEFNNRCFHEELITHDIIDSELLYFGRPFHPLCRLILEYKEQYLLVSGKKGSPNIIKEYRKKMYHDLPKLWFSLDDKERFPQIVKETIHGDVASNLGMLTNVIPLEQALVDLGYLNIFQKGTIDIDRPVAEISLDNKFLVELEGKKSAMTCSMLNIYRNPTQSWLKVRVSSKISSEI